jgi:O-antigen ligase
MYLLGGKNAIQMTMLPAISFFYLYSYVNFKKMKKAPFVAIALAILSIFISASGTGIVIALICTSFLFFPKKIAPNFYTYLLGYAALFFSIVIYRLQERLFGDFIENVLHKNLTFTNRTIIWDFVLNVLKGNWMVGLGRGNNIISENNFFGVNETHNGILEIIMYTGFVGLVIFVIILLLVAQNLNQNRNNTISRILAFSVFAYMIIGLSESVFFKEQFWVLITLACCIKEIINQVGDTESVPVLKWSRVVKKWYVSR